MRNLDNLYNFYRDLVRKERGVYIKPAQFTANLDAGQLDATEEWFAPYGEDQTLHDAVRKLRVYYQFASDAAGFVTYPSDYIHILGQPFTVAGSSVNRINFCNEDEVPFALTSQLRPVSNSYPIAVDTSTGFSIYPQQLQIGFFNYLKRPATPVYAYTQFGRAITYDPVNSVQLEFSDVYVNNILAKALVYAGVYMNDKEVTQYAEVYNEQTKTK